MNLYLSQEMYNKEFKERYLKTHEKVTQRYYKYVFNKSFRTEKRRKKDIYDFTAKELTSLIKTYVNGSIPAVQSVVTVLRGYIDFAIAKGYTENTINYLSGISGYKDYEKFLNINKIKNKIITKEELQEICYSCENAQDAICFALPFYGVKGQGSEEILNLKISDVDFTNEILRLTTNDGQIRHIKVDEFLIDLIYQAINEEEYISENGGIEKGNGFAIYKNDYVLRAGSKKTNEPAILSLVSMRITRVGRVLGNNRLTPMSLWYSGMYYKYLQIKDERKIEDSDYKDICNEFGYNEIYSWKIKAKMKEYDSIVKQ